MAVAGLLGIGRHGIGRHGGPELVVVTGAGSGIGRATSARFGALGSRVVCADIDLASATGTADAIPDGRGIARRLDVADPEAWERFGAWVRAEFGVPDVVVNNAGIGMGGAFLDHTAEDWRRIVDINLLGVAHGCRVFGRQLAERNAGSGARRGHLVNIATAAAFTPSRELPAYVATKAAVLMLSEALRAEMAEHDVGVSAICPGFIATNIYTATTFVGEVAADRGDLLKELFDRVAPGPDLVARRIVFAVRHDVPVLPVTVGAWVAYGTYHLAPPLMRLATGVGADSLLRRLGVAPVSAHDRSGTTVPAPAAELHS
jgi:NAD(P)-dependent dehydrogenase (short-subunit alcohol dehydrogenase family)